MAATNMAQIHGEIAVWQISQSPRNSQADLKSLQFITFDDALMLCVRFGQKGDILMYVMFDEPNKNGANLDLSALKCGA